MSKRGEDERTRYIVLIGVAVLIGAVVLSFGYFSVGDSGHKRSEGTDEKTPASPDTAERDGPESPPPEPPRMTEENGGADSIHQINESGSESISVPTDQRYFNPYSYSGMDPPTWIPEDEFVFEDHDVVAHEVTRYPAVEPTEDQLDAAWELYNRSYEAAERKGWFDFDEGIEDGYTLRDLNHHYVNAGNRSIYGTWGDMDPETPPTLLYFEDPQESDKMVLAGFMFHQPIGTNEEGEQVGGPLTVWHYHPSQYAHYDGHIQEFISQAEEVNNASEFFDMMGSDYESLKGYSENRERTSEMLHIWFIKHPKGPFSTSMSIPQKYVEEPVKMTEEDFKNYTMETFRKNKRTGEIFGR